MKDKQKDEVALEKFRTIAEFRVLICVILLSLFVNELCFLRSKLWDVLHRALWDNIFQILATSALSTLAGMIVTYIFLRHSLLVTAFVCTIVPAGVAILICGYQMNHIGLIFACIGLLLSGLLFHKLLSPSVKAFLVTFNDSTQFGATYCVNSVVTLISFLFVNVMFSYIMPLVITNVWYVKLFGYLLIICTVQFVMFLKYMLFLYISCAELRKKVVGITNSLKDVRETVVFTIKCIPAINICSIIGIWIGVTELVGRYVEQTAAGVLVNRGIPLIVRLIGNHACLINSLVIITMARTPMSFFSSYYAYKNSGYITPQFISNLRIVDKVAWAISIVLSVCFAILNSIVYKETHLICRTIRSILMLFVFQLHIDSFMHMHFSHMGNRVFVEHKMKMIKKRVVKITTIHDQREDTS